MLRNTTGVRKGMASREGDTLYRGFLLKMMKKQFLLLQKTDLVKERE